MEQVWLFCNHVTGAGNNRAHYGNKRGVTQAWSENLPAPDVSKSSPRTLSLTGIKDQPLHASLSLVMQGDERTWEMRRVNLALSRIPQHGAPLPLHTHKPAWAHVVKSSKLRCSCSLWGQWDRRGWAYWRCLYTGMYVKLFFFGEVKSGMNLGTLYYMTWVWIILSRYYDLGTAREEIGTALDCFWYSVVNIFFLRSPARFITEPK